MVSIPTVWLLFVVNFSALGLVCVFMLRGNPGFVAGRYWASANAVAALGAATGLARGLVDSPLPLIIGSGLLVLASCLAATGLFRFFRQPSGWRCNVLVTAMSVVPLSYFSYVDDNMAMRIVCYSAGQAIPIALVLRFLLSHPELRKQSPTIWLTTLSSAAILAVLLFRSVTALLGVGGTLQPLNFNLFQAVLVVVLAFLSMLWVISFLLLAFDRHRHEMASLAMVDELTGVANRRLLLQRLAELCEQSQLTGEPFAVLAIDLDGFKAINDRFGHGAGDECLRKFTRAAQERLRQSDLLARVGGDEFCVLMPCSSWREGALIARGVVEACQGRGCEAMVAISASVGVAQWTPAIGNNPERLIAAADQALYAAKKSGKNRYTVYDQPAQYAADSSPTLCPSPDLTSSATRGTDAGCPGWSATPPLASPHTAA